ncbi:MAG: pyrimidine-nucleoside phosphorylase [Armatimonadota bacterium]|nr:pyrimidine-nucleoside phosphorylase [Armatimonadota bacterium]MDR7447646.1 pyrimidine-nucleoside phosphorylase [Armatimonadota bacterium]MDR7480083.1 pyrimidine-nucleoside phosphorylase [Armatimonadota bacterium]MDR7488786.1 pyrimidine-nucleoside phosphorylase [Armatimonadota bacterium]MDR7491689.1 pyrimidine-nucleoside phosphorylase [Armatimonadota bacterium]
MRAYDLILRKRNGGTLAPEEIEALLQGFLRGEVPDYQMSAFLMAVYFQGMTPEETAALTMAMVRSGEVVDLREIPGVKVDKHSTGGVGDKTSLVLVPLVAAAGVLVPKLSGRSLGHTGGTLDKLEAIPGLSTALSREAFVRQVVQVGCAIAGQTADLVPADKRLYALRDVTATVDSVPLIASSVMSKKIAGGAEAIVLDVKTGSGAFMKTVDGARALAEAMVAIGAQVGRRTVAVISDMDQPLGRAVGNAVEVEEAIATLRDEGPPDLTELCLTLGAEMLVLGGAAPDRQAARARLEARLRDGSALDRFRRMVEAQGGDPRVVDDPTRLPQAALLLPVEAPHGGVVAAIDAEAVGLAAMALGAGRARQEDAIDPAVGVRLQRKVGEHVAAGDALATVLANDAARAPAARRRLLAAYRIADAAPPARPLIHGRVEAPPRP